MHNRSSLFAVCGVLFCSAAVLAQIPQPAQNTGQQLVAESARNLFDLPGLEAEFRYRVEAYDQKLVGSGRYLQSGQGPEKLFRLELSTQLEQGKATQQTICGKQYLWIRRDLGPERQSLARVNLRRLRSAIAERGTPLAIDPSPTWLGIVGLPKLMTSIGGWFVLEPAQESQLEERRVLRLRGVINPAMRDSLLSGSAKKGQGREQIPDAIELTLGTDDALPLFPYRIEYLKSKSAEEPGELSPMLTLDFYSAKVQNDFDPQQFEYFPGDQEVEDRTRLFLERLGFEVKDDR